MIKGSNTTEKMHINLLTGFICENNMKDAFPMNCFYLIKNHLIYNYGKRDYTR